MGKQRWSVELTIDTIDVRPFMSQLHGLLDVGGDMSDTLVDVMIRSYEEEEKESGRAESDTPRED